MWQGRAELHTLHNWARRSQAACIRTHFSVSSPPQCRSQVIVCVSTPRTHQLGGYIWVRLKGNTLYVYLPWLICSRRYIRKDQRTIQKENTFFWTVCSPPWNVFSEQAEFVKQTATEPRWCCQDVSMIAAGVPLKWVWWVRPNPSIFIEGAWTYQFLEIQ